ncbi:hybrid sensor histidine kinase/response regulator [Pararhodobacter marinus]|uniref:histidine kinase n=1 Tax=Pararhodobacter marinus TaxID=2184063 RepID=A0A2U2C5Y9_9RHOB|nr:response regulator [Pararhodobacter marinus]PWE27277.1 hybrid sensor histidine kinase/response regulator [Pararhodobacter marinus]
MLIAVGLLIRVIERNHSLYEVQDDNRTWTLAQHEVELLRLRGAAQDVLIATLAGRPDVRAELQEFRLRFDIVYSRHAILSQTFRSGRFPAVEGSASTLRLQAGFLEQTVPLVDGPDAPLIDAMPAIEAEIRALRNAIRPLAVDGLAAIAGESVAARDSLGGEFRRFLGATLVLALLMALMIVLALQQNRAAERRLAASQRIRHDLDQMIEASLDAVLLVDGTGCITLHNRAAAEMFTTGEAPLVGLRFDALIAPECSANLPARTGHGREDITARSPAGRQFPAEIVVAEARAAGQRAHIVFMRDMTDVVEREETLRRAHDAARRGEEAKARFLAVMSHEMRTPLNGVLATLDLLRPCIAGDAQALRYLRIIERSGITALDQVNDVLELARIDNSGAAAYPETVFSPAQFLSDMVEQNRASARANGNALDLVVAPGLGELWVRGRASLLLRVIHNFLGNAIKFTSDGWVTLRLSAGDPVPPAGAPVTLRMAVQDTGIGIEKADLTRIFENFETLDQAYGRVREGSGLGLGIARIAAETLGGRIEVDSAPGEGSTFALIVPLPRVEAPENRATRPTEMSADTADGALPKQGAGAGPEPMHILVADDNAINREVLQELLVADGHSVVLAADGHAAVSAALDDAFDVILMDINMPECDGIEATRRLRAEGVDTPVLAVTAMAGPEQHAQFREAGLCAVLLKPINRVALRDALRRARREDEAPRPAAPQPAPPQPATPSREALDAAIRDDLRATVGEAALTDFTLRALADWDAALTGLPALLAEDRLDAFAQEAHRTAGSLASVGLARGAALFRQLQHHAQAADRAALAPLLTEARDERLRAGDALAPAPP